MKILSLLTLSAATFLVRSWAGIIAAALIVTMALVVAKLPIGRIVTHSVPLMILLAFIGLCNAFVWDVNYAPAVNPPGVVPSEFLEFISQLLETTMPETSTHEVGFLQSIALWGAFGFSPSGALLGLSYAIRILIIVFAGYVVVFTTSAEELIASFLFLLKPLRKLYVPVDDVAMVLSLALRFIPLMAEEAAQLQRAQIARGARFGVGGLWARIHSWIVVLVPLVVAMFRRAATLANAMEARCYGAAQRSSLNSRRFSAHQAVCLGTVMGICGLLIAWL